MNKLFLIAGGIVLIAAILALGAWINMLLWNWLMPVIFELTKITFWQSAGLLMLSFLLFRNVPTGKN